MKATVLLHIVLDSYMLIKLVLNYLLRNKHHLEQFCILEWQVTDSKIKYSTKYLTTSDDYVTK